MKRVTFVRSLLACLLAAASGVAVHAQAPARITESISDADTVALPNSAPLWTQAGIDRGSIEPATFLDSIFLLLDHSPGQRRALEDLLDRQHDPASPSFHQWLTPEQFGAQFGPSDSDIAKISGWLQLHGAQIQGVAAGRQWIQFSASAAQAQALFQSEIHEYEVNGRRYFANASDLSLPRALTGVVRGILSLSNFEKPSMRSRGFLVRRDSTGSLAPVATVDATAEGLAVDSSPAFTTGSGHHFLSPGDVQRIYGISPLLEQTTDGTGVVIAIVGRTRIQLADVKTFRQIFGLPPNDPEIIVNGIDPGFNADEVEADLDVEWSGAAAPMAAIKLVTSATTASTDGVDLSSAYIVDHRVAPIMSSSYGLCEAFLGPAGNAFYNSLWRQAAAEGITVLVSAGDSGVAGCDAPVSILPPRFGRNVNGLASTPYNIAVGGTEFNENGLDATYWADTNRPDQSSAIGYIPEKAWNETCDPQVDPLTCGHRYVLLAGSGGPSNCSDVTQTILGNRIVITCLGGYSKPSWQAGPGVPGDDVRDLPDVSLTAAAGHDGYLICVEGACQTTTVDGHTQLNSAVVVGGTSASTPTMAGIVALVEQVHGQFQGQANFVLYRLAAAQESSLCDSSQSVDPAATTPCALYDTTEGNNNVPLVPGFQAGPGYDLATGLGSVNAANLVQRWSTGRKLETETFLEAVVRKAQHGQPIPLEIHVRSRRGAGNPSGAVALRAGAGFATSVVLSHGSFGGTVADLPGGEYRLVAHYGGDATFESSDSNGVHLVITPEDSVIKVQPFNANLIGELVPTTGDVFYGTPVGLQINVQGVSGVGAATGHVTIYDGATALGAVPVTGGSVFVLLDQFLSSSLDIGVHAFGVTYTGDASFKESSTPQPVPVTIIKAFAKFARIFGEAVSVPAGTSVTLHIVVLAPGTAVPSGTVQVYDNGVAVGAPIALNANVAKGDIEADYTASYAVGSHSIRIGYSGDGRYNPVTPPSPRTPPFLLTVAAATGISTTTQVTEASPTITVGQSETYMVTVSPASGDGQVPTGTVTLIGPFGSAIAGPRTLVDGGVTFVVPWSRLISFGTARLLAQYSGDAAYAPSISVEILTTVSPATPAVGLVANAPVVRAGTPSELSVTVQPTLDDPRVSLPFGSVRFVDSVDGSSPRPLGLPQFLVQGNGKFTISVLAVALTEGTHVITAEYLGLGQWGPATSNPVVVQVERRVHRETEDR